MTSRRWNKICDRWLTIALIPLIMAAIRNEVGSWLETLLIIIIIVCVGIAGAFTIAAIIACSEDILDWLKGY